MGTLRGAPPHLTTVAALALALASSACRDKGAIARLSAAAGSVEAARNESWASAQVGHTFHAGDAVRTGASSSAGVTFTTGRVLRIGENALVRFLAGQQQDDPQVGVDLGAAEMEGGGALAVATKRGLARLEPGARVRVVATRESTKFEVQVGRAVLLDADGEIALAAGDGLEIAGGGRPARYKVHIGSAVIEDLPRTVPDAAPAVAAAPAAGDAGGPVAHAEAPAREELPERDSAATADVVVPAGESAVIHDRHMPAYVRVALAAACPKGGTVEVARGTSFRKPRQRVAARTSAVLTLPAGAHRYRVVCAGGGPQSAGKLVVKADSGTAPVPRTAASNTIDTDGRRYTVLYQTRLPSMTFVWPGAPAAGPFTLHIETEGKERTVVATGARHTLPSGAVSEGSHSFWFTSGDAKSSRPTSVKVAFDNAAVTAQLSAPREGSAWSEGEVEIAGIALEGSTVTVAGQKLSLDPQGRFRGRAPRPGPGERAIAVRLEHPRTGVHYYVRRMASGR
jgi:hypothetical protein